MCFGVHASCMHIHTYVVQTFHVYLNNIFSSACSTICQHIYTIPNTHKKMYIFADVCCELYICICIYVYIYIYIYIYIYELQMSAHIYNSRYTENCICTHTSVYIRIKESDMHNSHRHPGRHFLSSLQRTRQYSVSQ